MTGVKMSYQEDLTAALIKRQALRRGLSVEEYLVVSREENIQYAMSTLNLSRGEVIAQQLDNVPRSGIVLEVQRRELSTKLGREITIRELLDQEIERMRALNYPGPDCLQAHEVEKYAKTGILDPDGLEHLKMCRPCRMFATHEREIYLEKIYLENNRPPGPECLSSEELILVEKGERLPEDRRTHVNSCHGCEKRFGKSQELWLNKVAPLPKWPGDRFPIFTE
jgi:hypothetical protein